MAAVDLMSPVIEQINALVLLENGEKEAMDQLQDVYGHKCDSQNLLGLLQYLAEEDKINPSRTVPLEEGLSSNPASNQKYKELVKRFKEEKINEISEWRNNQPKEFIGRDFTWLDNVLTRKAGIIIWGASGVGKTKFTKEFMSTKRDLEQMIIDVRGVTSINMLCAETLKHFGKLVSTDDAAIGLVADVARVYVSDHKPLLLFDNADDFVHYSGVGENMTKDFASLIRQILDSTHGSLKILITSRHKSDHPEADIFLHQEQLLSLKDNDASSIIESRMIHKKEMDSETTKNLVHQAAKQCQNLPLNLKIVSAALQEQGFDLSKSLSIIHEKAHDWKLRQEKENVQVPEEEINTFGFLAVMFERLSDTTQLAAVALSLFTRSFSVKSAYEILSDFSQSKVNLVLDYLKYANLITLDSDNDDKAERIYDMHPKVKEFLSTSVSFSKELSEFYLKAKQKFVNFFKEKLLHVSNFIDDDYLKAFELYQEDGTDIEFIFQQKGYELMLVEDYDNFQRVQMLFNGVLGPAQRLEYFKNLTETAFQHGKNVLGSYYLCWLAKEESFHNPIQALQYTLLRAQHNMYSFQEFRHTKDNIKHKHLKALFNYTKGDILYKIIHSSLSLETCEEAITSLEISVKEREELYPEGHTDLARTYMNLGNLFNIKEDALRTKIDYDEPEGKKQLEDILEIALSYYEKALNMRNKLSGSKLHVDSPQICQSIGTVWYERGRILKNYGLEREAMIYFEKAEKFFKESLEMERQLKLYGLYETSTKLINLGDMYKQIRDFEEAFRLFSEAEAIRRTLKGDHKDTVLVLYRMATVKDSARKIGEAVHYYKEAFEMEEKLPDDYHSAIRKQIRHYLKRALETWLKREKNAAERKRIEAEKATIVAKIEQLEKEERKKQSGKAPSKTPEETRGIAEPMAIDPVDVKSDEYLMADFDKSGAHVDFRYLKTYLTVPANLTETPQKLKLMRMPVEKAAVQMNYAEHLVSIIIDIHVDGWIGQTLKAPALLEIPCEIMDSQISSFSELCMVQYDEVTKSWHDVKDMAILHKRCYWYERNDFVSSVQAWISKFTMFAIILRPKESHFSVPSVGKTWHPWQDERISIDFSSETFVQLDTDCAVKVVMPQNEAVSEVVMRSGIVTTPAVSVTVGSTIHKKIRLRLPFLGAVETIGDLKLLRKGDESEAEWTIEDIETTTTSPFEDSVEFYTSTFSWLMVVWTPTTEVVNFLSSKIDWLTSSLLQSWYYEVEFHLYRGIIHKDQRKISVCCTPFTYRNDVHSAWTRRPRLLNYTYMDSAQSLERIRNFAMIYVDVKGQFINKPEEDKFRFNKDNPASTPFQVRESGAYDERGGDVKFNTEHGLLLCKIPYLGDFMINSDSRDEQEEFKTQKPLCFLGLRLDRCGLENISVYACNFRNNLYKMGLDEQFINELRDGPRLQLIRKLFDRITRKFTENELDPYWLEVIRENLHPQSTRDNLCQVINLLEEKNPCYQDVCRILNRVFLQENKRFASHLFVLLSNDCSELYVPQDREDYQPLLEKGLRRYCDCRKHRHSWLNLIRILLCLKKQYLFQDEVDRVLQDVGKFFEERIEITY